MITAVGSRRESSGLRARVRTGAAPALVLGCILAAGLPAPPSVAQTSRQRLQEIDAAIHVARERLVELIAEGEAPADRDLHSHPELARIARDLSTLQAEREELLRRTSAAPSATP